MATFLNRSQSKMILHMDGDAFFVGVEVAKNPKLKGLPVVTGQEKGIVTALSYEAKALGISRGMPVFRLKKLYPKVIILPGDYKSYADYSSRMFDIVRRYADDVEEYSIDECFADLTGLEPPLKMSYRQMAELIKKEITEELGLTVSVGLAPTKVLAKVASKHQKPDGLTVINQDEIGKYLSETPIGKIWGIGAQTSVAMMKKGIKTAQDFVMKDVSWVREHLSKPHEAIWQELRGVSVMELDPHSKTEYSSMQRTRSFHPATNDEIFLLSQFSKNMEEACAKARHFQLVPKAVSIFLKTRDFQYINRSFNLTSPTNTPEPLMALVREHFKGMHVKGVLYRTTGVSLLGLVPEGAAQNDLFGGTDRAHRFEAVHKQIDKLEEKHGKRMVYLASTHDALKSKGLGTEMEDLDRDLLFL